MFPSLVAGLGNPGRQYERTRHNLGWLVMDALVSKHGLEWKRSAQFEAEVTRWQTADGSRTCWLAKPQTFMNDSGDPVGRLARFHRIDPARIVVVHDELAVATGQLKVSVGGSAGGHNGVASLIDHLGDGFVRYRLGIGPKEPPQMELSDYVLGKFTPEQENLVTQKLDHFVQGLELLLTRGVEPAMNQLNRRETK